MQRPFAELLQIAQQALNARLSWTQESGGDVRCVERVVQQLFEAGFALGLTRQEIAQALLGPVRAQIRPGLKR